MLTGFIQVRRMLRLQIKKADQLTTADKQRFSGYIGSISEQEMQQLDNAILIQLGIKKC